MDDNGIAVWFPPAAAGTAHDGLEALVELDDKGSIRLIRAAVAERGADGALAVSEKAHSTWGRGATIGGVIGGIIGVLGGPVGIALGGSAGAALGAAGDAEARKHARKLAEVVAEHPEPGAVLLLAEVSEVSPDAVDGAIARLGGEITRRSVFDIERELAERRDGDGADGQA
jgi:uncharacterized membrane protein